MRTAGWFAPWKASGFEFEETYLQNGRRQEKAASEYPEHIGYKQPRHVGWQLTEFLLVQQ